MKRRRNVILSRRRELPSVFLLSLFMLWLLCSSPDNNHTISMVVLASQAAGQETLIGIVGRDFVLLGADSSIGQGFALTSSNVDKITPLVNPNPTLTMTLSTGTSSKAKGDGNEEKTNLPQSHVSNRHLHNQQCIVAAAAGDAAMSDRLIAMLQSQATIREFEAGVGCDVIFVNSKDEGDTDADADNNRPSSISRRIDDDVEVSMTGGLTVKGMAYFARSQLSSIRPNANVCLLIAGMMVPDEDENVEQYEMNLKPNNSQSLFVSSQVQNQVREAWNPTLTEEDATVLPTGISATKTAISMQEQPKYVSSLSVLRPYLYWLDELGSLQRIQYGAHGLGSNFCLSVLDQGYRPDMNLEEATALMNECFQQLRSRYLINTPQPPCIKVVHENGIQLVR